MYLHRGGVACCRALSHRVCDNPITEGGNLHNEQIPQDKNLDFFPHYFPARLKTNLIHSSLIHPHKHC